MPASLMVCVFVADGGKLVSERGRARRGSNNGTTAKGHSESLSATVHHSLSSSILLLARCTGRSAVRMDGKEFGRKRSREEGIKGKLSPENPGERE